MAERCILPFLCFIDLETSWIDILSCHSKNKRYLKQFNPINNIDISYEKDALDLSFWCSINESWTILEIKMALEG